MSDEAKLALIFVLGWVLIRGCSIDESVEKLTKRVQDLEAKQSKD